MTNELRCGGAMAGACVCLALVLPGPARAGSPEVDAPEAGTYEVEVRLELPHIEDRAARSTVQFCLEKGQAEARGLPVLSANNPLRDCPVSDLRREGGALTFSIACPGRSAAWASARYDLAPTAFRGRISMWMGGKNMTMTEVQAARRIGPCDAGVPDR